jgi:hypothetical protein
MRGIRTVIVRLDRTIQYPEAVAIKSRGPGVLVPPLSRGTTTWGAVVVVLYSFKS